MRIAHLILILSSFAAGPAHGQIYVDQSFEATSITENQVEGGWTISGDQASAKPYSGVVSTEQAVTGKQSCRFELRFTDPIVRNKMRSEIRVGTMPGVRSEAWFSWSFMVDPNQQWGRSLGCTIAQIHGAPDLGDYARTVDGKRVEESYRNPVWAVRLGRGRLSCVLKADSRPVTQQGYTAAKSWNVANITKGQWYHFVVHCNFDYRDNGDGFFKLWLRRDGESDYTQIINYDGPVGFNDLRPPYFKVGIYNYTWSLLGFVDKQGNRPKGTPDLTKIVTFYDNLRVGGAKSTFADMVVDGNTNRLPH